MSALTMLNQANYIYEHHQNMDRQALVDAAVSLGEWGVFSARSIAKITGLPHSLVTGLVKKSDKSGGRFEPEALPALIDLVKLRNKGEVDVFKAQEALVLTSSYFAAKLTGLPRTTLARWAAQADSMREIAA